MGVIDPDLTVLRETLSEDRPELVDKVAIGGGLLLMGAVFLKLLYDLNQPGHYSQGSDIMILLLMPIASFITGSLSVYVLYYGAKTVLFITKHFWWVFVLGIIALYYFENH